MFTLNDLNVIRHLGSGNGVHIVCRTGIKQAYILFCILAFSEGVETQTLVYSTRLVMCVSIQYPCITFITGLIDSHLSSLNSGNEHVTKYAFLCNDLRVVGDLGREDKTPNLVNKPNNRVISYLVIKLLVKQQNLTEIFFFRFFCSFCSIFH